MVNIARGRESIEYELQRKEEFIDSMYFSSSGEESPGADTVAHQYSIPMPYPVT